MQTSAAKTTPEPLCRSRKQKLMRDAEIYREPIELFQLLKFEGLASSGGEAKMFIADGLVRVNGDRETRKRRKILAGDMVEFAGESIRVVLKG